MSGYLQRSKGNKKQGKRLWFVVKNKVLYTYAASEVGAAVDCIVNTSDQDVVTKTLSMFSTPVTHITLMPLLFYIFRHYFSSVLL